MTPGNRTGLRGRLASGLRKIVEQPLYSVAISAYRQGVRLAALRNRKAKLLSDGQKEIFPKLEAAVRPGDRYVWIHAASLGEFEQGRPLIEALRRDHPEFKILLTFFSPSGYEVRKDYAGADCVCYLPFDTPGRVKRFLDTVKPEMAIFVKYEFWRNYLHELARRKVPTYLVSAVFRPDQPFFRKRSAWYAEWLKCYSFIFVQDSGSERLLRGIGLTDVAVAGDTRFDRVTDILRGRKPIPELEAFSGRTGAPESGREFVMMFGSSWPEDEAVYGEWLRKRTQVCGVIAPHEFDGRRLAALKEIVPGETVLLSEVKADSRAAEGKRVLVIDCFGLLSSAYAYADAVYVGGGFGVSIHNINEAAVYGVPVMFGPENSKFIEAQELKALGGGIEVDSADSFARNADRLLFDEAERRKRGKWAGDYIAEKTGASRRILDRILPSQ